MSKRVLKVLLFAYSHLLTFLRFRCRCNRGLDINHPAVNFWEALVPTLSDLITICQEALHILHAPKTSSLIQPAAEMVCRQIRFVFLTLARSSHLNFLLAQVGQPSSTLGMKRGCLYLSDASETEIIWRQEQAFSQFRNSLHRDKRIPRWALQKLR